VRIGEGCGHGPDDVGEEDEAPDQGGNQSERDGGAGHDGQLVGEEQPEPPAQGDTEGHADGEAQAERDQHRQAQPCGQERGGGPHVGVVDYGRRALRGYEGG